MAQSSPYQCADIKSSPERLACYDSFFAKNKNLKIRNPKTIRPWQHVLEPLYGYIILAEKIFANKNKRYCTSWNFGPSRRINVSVLSFAKILKSKMNSKSKLLVSKKIDKKEKKNLISVIWSL